MGSKPSPGFAASSAIAVEGKLRHISIIYHTNGEPTQHHETEDDQANLDPDDRPFGAPRRGRQGYRGLRRSLYGSGGVNSRSLHRHRGRCSR